MREEATTMILGDLAVEQQARLVGITGGSEVHSSITAMASVPSQPLYLADVGRIVHLQRVSGDPAIRAQLDALGLVQGTELCLLRVTFAGPLIVSIKNEPLVLSREMTKNVWVH